MARMIGNSVPHRGPGGRDCACCAESPRRRKVERRQVKRSERARVRRELRDA